MKKFIIASLLMCLFVPELIACDRERGQLRGKIRARLAERKEARQHNLDVAVQVPVSSTTDAPMPKLKHQLFLNNTEQPFAVPSRVAEHTTFRLYGQTQTCPNGKCR